ncbi:hypothetical protein K492DRAFT_173833 [Lichtheimia hyalospora FSU 10163]|nr:hypothetical protein K492DRAFT_173833 [Lichtheimia hyalospora FSU 10163]
MSTTTLTIKIIDKKPSDDRSMLNTSSVSPTISKAMAQNVKYKHSVFCDCHGSGMGCECTQICECTTTYVPRCECGRGCHRAWDPCMLA